MLLLVPFLKWFTVKIQVFHLRFGNPCVVISGSDNRKKNRWWAKDQVLRKVSECFKNPQETLCFELLVTLDIIVEDTSQEPTVRVKAKGLIEGLLKYETVLTAPIFLHIFEHTSSFSKHLRTRGIDVLTAQHLR